MTALALLSLFLLSSVGWTATEAKGSLPKTTKPTLYKVHMTPDLQKFEFSGTVDIDFTVLEKTSLIVLNQKDLIIKNIVVTNNVVKHKQLDDHVEALSIYLQNDLAQNSTQHIKIDFHGSLSSNKRGFYRSKYLVGKEVKWIATTHFEPTGARLAFPCWDEPEYKANFDISITHLNNYTAVISNMPVVSTTQNGSLTTTNFQRSKLMSTYLVAFIVSDYAYINHPKSTFKIYTKKDSVNDTEYAWSFSEKAMQALGDVTGIPYSKHMPKMDQATIKDFSPGAMENWGLVTYRETYLLYKEGVTTTRTKENIATTIAHEFAHQWFGNLVSPKWWEYIWLNEGFANFLQYYITDKVEPSWRLMEMFAVSALQGGAFSFDGLVGTRPMNKDVDSPTQIPKLFDKIAYQKAGSVIRMLSHVLTEKVIQTGLKNYLTANAYGVADSDNLVKHLQTAAGDKISTNVKLEEIVRNWITKAGYPVVTVKKNGAGNYILSQERFLYYGSDTETKWWIPITYVTKNDLDFTNTSVTHWMNPKENGLTISVANSDWILLNKQQTGYYRVNYEDELWKSLSQYLQSNFKKIHPVNRAQLIDDALNLARRNLTNYGTALSLTLYLNNETDYIPWMATFANLDFLHNLISHSKNSHMFKDYIRFIMQSLTTNVTYAASSNDDHVTKILKGKAMKWACLAEVKECLEYAHKEFNAWVKDSKHPLDPDLKNTILCTGLTNASEAVWDGVLKTLSESTFDQDERNSLLTVMGCSRNEKILEKLLIDSAKPEPKINFDVVVQAIVANHPLGVETVLKVIEKQFVNTSNTTELISHIAPSVSILGSAVVNEKDFLKLTELCVKVGAGADVVQSVVEKTTRNMKWVSTYGSAVDNWLINNRKTFNSSGTLAFTSFLLILSIFITRFY